MILGTASAASQLGAADWVEPVEIQTRDQWAKGNLRDPKGKLPFSFVFDGQASDQLLVTWPSRTETKVLEANRVEHATDLDRSENRPRSPVCRGGV